MKICVFQCLCIKLLGLHRIYLIKRQRRNLIGNISNPVCDIFLAPEQTDFFPKDHIAAFLIYIDGDTCHSRNLTQRFYNLLLFRNLISVQDQTDHYFLCEVSVTDQNMTHQTLTCCFIVWLNPVFLHMCDHTVQNFFILRYTKCTVTVLDNVVGSSCIETCNDFSLFISAYRKLCLISVMKKFIHANDRLHGDICKAADTFQMSLHLICLKYKLLVIGKCLKLAAAALTGESAFRLYSVWRWFQYLHQAAVAVIFFCFNNFGCYCISDYCVLDKNGEAIGFSDTFTVNSAIFYL